MSNPYGTTSAWNKIAEAYDDLAHVSHHRPLAGDACSCGQEFTTHDELMRHVEAASDA